MWLLVSLLIVVPTALYAAVLVVPFLALPTGWKLWTASGLVVAAETVFWVSALFLGKEVVYRYRRYFDPRRWFGRK